MKCGLLGSKLGHSYSPQIHSYLGAYSYELFEKQPDELEDFLKNGDFTGLNVTIPYKKAVIPYCQQLSPQAKLLGAVNTIVRQEDGSLIGHNTDYFGFQWMTRQLPISYAGKKVLVLGSGGASATVCAVMREAGAEVIVISRNGENNYSNLERHSDCAVIVNATPVGMYPANGYAPVDLSLFPNLQGVMDLIYNPANTKLLLDAQQRGIPAVNGLGMLVAQAKESAQWFTGKSISDDIIPKIHKQLKQNMENIVLIGMPGCGKTTIGRILSEKLNKPLLDTDERIEEYAGCPIPQIFQDQGEEGFRRIETTILAEDGKKSGNIIATGGGCVTRKENYPLLRQNGIVIWIRRDIAQLPTDGRPLSQKNDLADLYKIRRPMYASFCHYIVENSGSCEDTAEQIIKILEEL